MSDSSRASLDMEWCDASDEDGILYARAEALGASKKVLAKKAMTVAFLSIRESGQGKP